MCVCDTVSPDRPAHTANCTQDELARRIKKVDQSRECDPGVVHPGNTCVTYSTDTGKWEECDDKWYDGKWEEHSCKLGSIVGQVTYTEMLTEDEADKEICPRLRVKGSRAYRIDRKSRKICWPFLHPVMKGKSRRWKNITKESQEQLNRSLCDFNSATESDESSDENEEGEVNAATSALLALKKARAP